MFNNQKNWLDYRARKWIYEHKGEPIKAVYCENCDCYYIPWVGHKCSYENTDLNNKCGSCVYAKPIKYSKKCRVGTFVQCENPVLMNRRKGVYQGTRARCYKACKQYVKGEYKNGEQ